MGILKLLIYCSLKVMLLLVLIQDEALYVAVKMNYVDDIERLLKNGAKSTFCDYVSDIIIVILNH